MLCLYTLVILLFWSADLVLVILDSTAVIGVPLWLHIALFVGPYIILFIAMPISMRRGAGKRGKHQSTKVFRAGV